MSGDTDDDELGHSRELGLRVVEAVDQQRDDLHPQTAGVQRADGVQDWLQAPAQFSVLLVVEALEIDLVEIDPRREVVDNL